MNLNTIQHLVFYDGECGLCDRAVQMILKVDKHKRFAFAPLQGTTAQSYLAKLPPELKPMDTVILVENYKEPGFKIEVMSKAVFRIFWLAGGIWMLPGVLSFFPGFLFDWGYRLVARYRHQLFPQITCFLPSPDEKERFLP